MSKQTFFILCGERSGEQLGAYLTSGLIDRGHRVYGWGGAEMKSAGASLQQDISDISIMGWTQVFRQLGQLVSLLRLAKKHIKQIDPDKIILVDYGSFNLRIATWAKQQGYYVVYYSPPKIWASRPQRIHQLKQCDKIITLFSFEQQYYQDHGIAAECFGHPLAEGILEHEIDPSFRSRYHLNQDPILGIFPGSRKEEVQRILPIFLEAGQSLDGYQSVISSTKNTTKYIHSILEDAGLGSIVVVSESDYHHLMASAEYAFVTSGTATWEAAMHGTPQVVGYKTSPINYAIAKRLIKVRYISLVNLIMDQLIVGEYLQSDLKAASLTQNIISKSELTTKSQINNSYKSIQSMSYNTQNLYDTMVAIIG